MNEPRKISWSLESNGVSKFFYDVQIDDDTTERRMGMLKRTVIVFDFPHKNGSDKIAFMKTNRSKNFRDSRFPKKSFPENEILSEFQRWVGSSEGVRALITLKA